MGINLLWICDESPINPCNFSTNEEKVMKRLRIQVKPSRKWCHFLRGHLNLSETLIQRFLINVCKGHSDWLTSHKKSNLILDGPPINQIDPWLIPTLDYLHWDRQCYTCTSAGLIMYESCDRFCKYFKNVLLVLLSIWYRSKWLSSQYSDFVYLQWWMGMPWQLRDMLARTWSAIRLLK